MRNGLKLGCIGALPILLIGCATLSGPAVLSEHTPEAHAELEAAVSKAMNGKKVNLSQNVLIDTNTLSVEQKQYRSISGDPLMGRRMDRPSRFTLNLKNGTCVLTHDETGNSYDLPSARCALIETN